MLALRLSIIGLTLHLFLPIQFKTYGSTCPANKSPELVRPVSKALLMRANFLLAY